MSGQLLIVGGGGHARVLIDALRQSEGPPIAGIVDPTLTAGSLGPFGILVLGGDDVIDGFSPADIRLVNAIGSVGSMDARDALHKRFVAKGFRFAGVRHPSAVVSPAASLADDAQVMAGAVVQCGAIVGLNCILNTHCSVDHDCEIGDSVHIAPGATLSGSVKVGNATHVGTGACVIQGIVIGSNCTIAAGAVIHRGVPDNERVISQ